MSDQIVNERLHPAWRLYRIKYRSGRTIRIWAPSAASAREQALNKGDVMDPKGAAVASTDDVTPIDRHIR